MKDSACKEEESFRESIELQFSLILDSSRERERGLLLLKFLGVDYP